MVVLSEGKGVIGSILFNLVFEMVKLMCKKVMG